MYPYSNQSLIFKGLTAIKNIKWGALLDGTQKTLGVINQAIPVFYQVKPIISNAKTLFKVANIINKPESSSNGQVKEIKKETNNSPIFYI